VIALEHILLIGHEMKLTGNRTSLVSAPVIVTMLMVLTCVLLYCSELSERSAIPRETSKLAIESDVEGLRVRTEG
jgi:hypothetical protein